MADRERTCGEGQQGLTLLECLATLAIIAIVTAIAIPSFRDQIADAQARAAATTLYAAMQFARSTAQRRRQIVVLCPMVEINPEQPHCAGIWATWRHTDH